jgi:MscS family membrane protein
VLGGVTRGVLRRVSSHTDTTWDDKLLVSIGPPIGLGWALFVFAGLGQSIGLAKAPAALVAHGVRAASVTAFFWALWRSVDLVVEFLMSRPWAADSPSARHLFSIGANLAKGVIGALGVLALLAAVGYEVTTVLAGLGIGGLALAFGAQKTVENLFGSMALAADQPFRVGDFVKVEDFTGTVEDIGLRSTRLRTVDRTVVSVPNAQFSTEFLENFGARDRIRLYQVLNLRYETTPDQLRWLLAELRRLLYSHPMIDREQARVRFVNYGPSSLDVEIFCFVRTTDIPVFAAVREDVFLRVMDIVGASGSGFAFPSQTLYLGRDTGVDASRTRAAEEQVEAWRRQGELPFPDFAEQEIGALEGTLSYPPEGSTGRPG